ncbi:MAG: hypothetical protein IKV80_10750 [Bacteroidales bacterium]|nr:hypothetical protein [Bacteroidales bacterium]
MKKLSLLLFLYVISLYGFSQDDEYQKYLESLKKEQSEFMQKANEQTQKLSEEYDEFVTKANVEFAEFLAKEWTLFEEFKTQELSMTLPKINKLPEAPKSDVTDVQSGDVQYKDNAELPQVSVIYNVDAGDAVNYTPRQDNYVVRKVVTSSGVKEISKPSDFVSYTKANVMSGQNVSINFYGKKLDFNVDDKLRLKHKGIKETDVADYFKEISKMSKETSDLWKQIDAYVNTMGLNEWGYFCILRSLSESMFSDIDNCVLFNFYMLRNEGDFKVKIARGKDSNKLTLLAVIDNSKEVYSYSFFRFKETENTSLKYYSIYGGGGSKESIYTYNNDEQNAGLKQMGLDFYNTLNMGQCDVKRELNIAKINDKLELPYNSAHIAYLNDVPMTVFPIYFASPLSIEAQRAFNEKLNDIKQEYTSVQFIDIILNFVQTAFDYKTDDQQFGYEKYFYPEEVIAYPYSDCEDRSALFAWLVTTYTDAKVVGLQYEGHLATAVCFGDNVNISGDAFSYAGKKYYVCDPTYINATIGMTMPQFKDKMPKIVKMSK